MRRITTFIALCLVAISIFAQSTTKHVVQAGETFSSIARSYGISMADLSKLNPTVQPDVLRAGQSIVVPGSTGNATSQARPKYKTRHEVKKKETIYSISQHYNITQEQLIDANPELRTGKLKKGSIINIPYSEPDNRVYEESIREAKVAEEKRRKDAERRSALNVAVVLPFSLSSPGMSSEMQRMANLYQGFLLAVDTLKHQGYSVNVYAYDEDDADIYTILCKPMMKNMQLIVGPMRQQDILAVADFAHTNNIAHVVPMSNSVTALNDHPTTFQVNTPNSALYSMVSSKFVSMHRGDNIIFLTIDDNDHNAALQTEMKRALDDANEFYRALNFSEASKLKDMLNASKRNVIVPSSGSATAFSNLCNKLNSLRIDDGVRIQLFGTPEWQTMASKHQANMAKYNCQFFTSFYHNPYASATKHFEDNFARWFHQPQYRAFPRYGELGYDIGMYFIKGLKQYGKAFLANPSLLKHNSLEFPLNFERKNEWSGWRNKSMIIVTYDTNGRVNINHVE